MNQEIKLEIYNSTDKKWENYISTYNEDVRLAVKPYIVFSLYMQQNTPTQAEIQIGNPPTNLMDLTASNNGSIQFRVSIGYSNNDGGAMDYTKIAPVFIGGITNEKPPYFKEAGTGADQIFCIPLITTNSTPANTSPQQWDATTTIDNILTQIFTDETITYEPSSLKSQKTTRPYYIKGNMSIMTIIKNIQKNEGLLISNKGNGTIIVSKDGSIDSSANTTLLYNKEMGDTSLGAFIANTLLKTKYAFSINGLVELELACVVPQLLAYNHISIENVGTNIILYNTQGKTYTTYTIRQQNIVFGSFGESMHKIVVTGNN